MRCTAAIATCIALTWGVAVVGCGYADKGLGPPDIKPGPVAPLQVEVVNPTAQDLFIDWTDLHAHANLSKTAEKLVTDKTCLPLCGDECACAPCAQPAPSAKRIAAGASTRFSLDAVHYVERSCGTDAGCTCVMSWPLTSGDYELTLQAYASVSGGTPSATDPDVLVGAELPADGSACTAAGSFTLGPSTQVVATLGCAASPASGL